MLDRVRVFGLDGAWFLLRERRHRCTSSSTANMAVLFMAFLLLRLLAPDHLYEG
jgi:hypothetical protein